MMKKLNTKQKNRSNLMQEIKNLIREIALFKKQNIPTQKEVSGLLKFWLNLFSSKTLADLSCQDLESFKSLLESKLRSEKRKRCFPYLFEMEHRSQ